MERMSINMILLVVSTHGHEDKPAFGFEHLADGAADAAAAAGDEDGAVAGAGG